MKIRISFILFVILPIVIAIVYYISFASGQYFVETKYVIQGHTKQTQNDLLGAFSGLGSSASSSAKDSYIAQQYIWSTELLNKLDQDIRIKEHYSNKQYDWWARLANDASHSDYLEYWQDVVVIEYDETSGITTLEVTAFTADYAFEIAKKLLEEAERHVNKLSKRSRKDLLDFAKNELKDAEQKLIQARADVTTFRNTQNDIDPEKTTAARLELVADLESKLTAAQIELSSLAEFMQPNTFKMRSLKKNVDALKSQLNKERKRWGNTKNTSNTLSTKIADYEKLLAKKAVAEQFYESALSSLEAARLNAIQQQQYLEVIAAPYKPSEAEKPYILKNVVSVVLGSFLLWVIGILVISAIKDHS